MPRTRQGKASKTNPNAPPTIKEVAERAGVSTATVSRVLSGKPGAGQESIERVREAISALNYRPNRVARTLRRRVAQIIGVVISDIQNPFFTSLVRGVETVLEKAEYTLLLSNSDEDPKREMILLNTLQAEGVAGIILAPAKSDSDALRHFAQSGFPLVTIDRALYKSGIDSVRVNNQGGVESAVAHLVAQGHTHIAFVSGPDLTSTGYERSQGYFRGLENAGLPIRPEYVCSGDFRQEGGYYAMLALLDVNPRPTAVITGNNLMTLGALQAIHQRGLFIPNEIAVVGFDDMPWATSLQPPLTAIAQPTYELGTAAAQLILERIAMPNRAVRQIILDTDLIVRASSEYVNHPLPKSQAIKSPGL